MSVEKVMVNMASDVERKWSGSYNHSGDGSSGARDERVFNPFPTVKLSHTNSK